jgi:ABC-2 type transport system permease protein
MQRFYWTIRRELWENRSIYIAPLAGAAVFLVAFMIRLPLLPRNVRAAAGLDAMQQRAAFSGWYDGVAGLMMLTVMVVATFYCLDTLYGERRDRSVLFWKSLPVSDATTVIAKSVIPLFVVPIIAYVVATIAQFLMAVMSSAVLGAAGLNVNLFWQQLAFPRMSLLLFYHLITVHSLWVAPIYGWFLLVSAWARRAPFVWAFVPPIALLFLEKFAFGTTHLRDLLASRFTGEGMDSITMPQTMPTHPMTQLTPLRFFTSTSFFVGIVIFVLCVAVAARMRRQRGPI